MGFKICYENLKKEIVIIRRDFQKYIKNHKKIDIAQAGHVVSGMWIP